MHQASNSTESWIIISDVHLGGFDSQTNSMLMQEFGDVLKFAAEGHIRLIINGDLFDYYMEYDGDVPQVVTDGMSLINNYSRTSSLKPVFITGNHDNWDDGYLMNNGCEVIHEEYVATIGPYRVLIAHGDGLNSPELGLPRPLMHRFLRNQKFIRIFKGLTTMTSGNWIMKWFSRINRRFDSGNKKTTHRIDSWALKMLQKGSFDVVIAAHHHNPKFIKVSDKLYLNSGCFYRDRTMIRYTNNRFELVKWDNQTTTLIPHNLGNSDT
jgi:UDP-2,3-diacylglucosamine hydrolase